MNQIVQTEVLSLAKIVEEQYRFIIPSYQRPYVWGDDNVLELLKDIELAYQSKENHYFIGTVLSSKTNLDQYELIDGQQRTTTLMLIALAFQNVIDEEDQKKHPIAKASVINGKFRITFEVRDAVENLLGSYAKLEKCTKPSDEMIQNNVYLKHINAGLKVLTQRLNLLKQDSSFVFEDFADFVYKNVRWVNNIIPHTLDLNRLFSSLNTAGIQLEPVDLLKAKILKKIKSHRPVYEAIWSSCQNMGNYFERNIRQNIETQCWNRLKYTDLSNYDSDTIQFKNLHSKRNDLEGLSIADIWKKKARSIETTEYSEIIDDPEVEAEMISCRSIISFDLLLIHTLRVLYALEGVGDIDARVKGSNLQTIFESLLKENENSIKKFIKTLWQVRYHLDTWVVKWVEDNGEDQLRLTSPTRTGPKSKQGKAYFVRSINETNAIGMLQSVRFFTGERSAQYWLTPFLAVLISKNISHAQDVLETMELIDNKLSLTTDLETQKTASFKLACRKFPDTEEWKDKVSYFEKDLGTGFEHYWFQKLEYVLWKNVSRRSDTKFKKYRITSKNSVEHVHPQKDRNGRNLETEWLDNFGNLVLLSPGQNSEYSNKYVSVKKAEFEGKGHYDSLKLKAIFDLMDKLKSALNSELIERHRQEMMLVLEQHYK